MRQIVAFLQARTDSSRLPQKVLKPLLGKPMILQEMERIQKSHLLDQLVLLTSDEASDNVLSRAIESAGFMLFRGSKNDVLERFFQCASFLGLDKSDLIVRLTGDCPVHDASIIDEQIEAFLKESCDYMTNSIEPVYPDGLDVEIFTFEALEKAYKYATLDSEREHVTPYIRESGFFKVKNLQRPPIHPEWRLTVDEFVDFLLIEKIYQHFGTVDFTFDDLVVYLEENSALLEINGTISRNEGYMKSLEEDSQKRNKIG